MISIFVKSFSKKTGPVDRFEPEVTLFIAAYNEMDFVDKKVKNSFDLNYPKEKLHHIWVTDGSDDGTPEALRKYTEIEVHHEHKRNGKIGAIQRGMRFVKTPIVIFSDANSILNRDAIRNMVAEFNNPKVGCVTGEKRIVTQSKDDAVNFGEGIYWKYESFLKKNESITNSALGAVGELFAIRTNLFEEVESDTILDDFIISLRIALKGYKIKYCPHAYAIESASINVTEELKRKTRIAYGGFQAMGRLPQLFNISRYPILSFQYISHKILRWVLVPFSFLFLFFVNLFITYMENGIGFYSSIFYLQLLFYLFVLIGVFLQAKKTNLKFIFAPYYLFIMNLSEIIGLIRFIRKKQSVNWVRAKRQE
ncbi:MAG: glycosyltransferase family 2 protein [Bacteroidetes bacterium]|nr:glycosyltransferase family 2 protein [Bacteroidota bacterium]